MCQTLHLLCHLISVECGVILKAVVQHNIKHNCLQLLPGVLVVIVTAVDQESVRDV